MFKFLADVVDVAAKTVVTGVAGVADVATLGGELTDKKGKSTYTEDALDNLGNALDDLIDG